MNKEFWRYKRLVILSGATSIEKYDLRANTWSHVASMSGRRLQFGVAVVDGRLYVVGGRDGLKTLNTVECYDIKSKTWTTLPPMSTHRHGLGNYCLNLWAVVENSSDDTALIQFLPYTTSTYSFFSDCHGNCMSHTFYLPLQLIKSHPYSLCVCDVRVKAI
jgi:hypothetical protein